MYSEYVQEQRENAEKYYERGEYYEEQGDDAQAFDNYLKSLQCYAYYINRVFTGDKAPFMTQKEMNSYFVELLFVLFIKLGSIGKYYGEVYISAKLEQIFGILSKYKEEFDVSKLRHFERLSEIVRKRKNILEKNQEFLETIKKTDPEREPDETLKEIRLALLKISEAKICLEPLERTSGCFIATAAYSTSTHPDLETFRSFRDQKLLTNSVGKQLVSFYYKISPSVAHYLEQQTEIKVFVKQQLGYLARWMRRKGITRI